MAPSPITVLIVGLGNIGFGYDKDLTTDQIFTHTKAVMHHDSYQLLGGIDPDSEIQKEFLRSTKMQAWSDIHSASKDLHTTPDLIALSVPTEKHSALVRESLSLRPKLFLLEKPIAYNREDCTDIHNMVTQAEVDVAVNYMRRWDPAVQQLKSWIEEGRLGRCKGGSVNYLRGVFVNGSHFIDLLHFLFGNENTVTSIKVKRKSKYDLLVDFAMDYDDFSIENRGHEEDGVRTHTFSLEFEKASFTTTDGGFHWKVKSSDETLALHSQMDQYQHNVYNCLETFFSNKTAPISNLATATEALNTCLMLSSG